ncbi:gallidermin/nisin family lantibiotic [Lactobacillus bombicola]|uniref:gallidermin/nisin family lantibiotic n=1 Tax=Lactobacillus bombicola TaxID=1505723 RepID=UPI000E57BE12|nr:gallidermin/nisin family lantibiotic [Lactobacillus bombicola]RHW53255.1 gallidermin family protein [Lactobacillus bombicola]
MTNFSDFDLQLNDVTSGSKRGLEPRITSKSLCTPGCITGRLMGCNSKASYKCSINIGSGGKGHHKK